jgi:LacI family transcriptional regulator
VRTLKELARALDLSITTVSRALAGYSDVAAETQARVVAAAAAHGYRPNTLARRLQKGRSEAVALVLPAEPGHFDEPLFMEMIVAIGARLARADLDLIVMAARQGAEEEKAYRRLVEGRRADAAIVVRTRRRDSRIRYLLDRGFPFVAHGRTEETDDYAFVDGDGEAAFRTATAMLIARGHRDIALINAPGNFMFAHLRATGWRAALAQAGLMPGPMLVAEPSEENGYRLTRTLVARKRRPDAVLCATDRFAIGALRAVADEGLRAGTDISIVGHDNISAATYTDPPLTTLELPIHGTGERLVEILLAVLGGARPRDFQEVWPVRLVERRSHGPAPAARPRQKSETLKNDTQGGSHARTSDLAP